MIDISLGGLIGAIVGTVVAAGFYGVFAAAVQRAVVRSRPQEATEVGSSERRELALLRRGVLALDILIFGGIGYWLGQRIGG